MGIPTQRLVGRSLPKTGNIRWRREPAPYSRATALRRRQGAVPDRRIHHARPSRPRSHGRRVWGVVEFEGWGAGEHEASRILERCYFGDTLPFGGSMFSGSLLKGAPPGWGPVQLGWGGAPSPLALAPMPNKHRTSSGAGVHHPMARGDAAHIRTGVVRMFAPVVGSVVGTRRRR
jgi:hypothetical protein